MIVDSVPIQCWDEMESRLGGDFPEEGSAREQQFVKGL